MLPEIGASELLVIAIVALIVVGPKDLPVLLRKLGQWVAKMRGMANEFRASFDEMARQSELDDLRREVEAMRSGSYINPTPTDEAGTRQVFADIEASLQGGGVQFPPVSAPAVEIEADRTIAAPAPAKRKRTPKATAAPVAADPPAEAAPKARKPRAPRKPAGSAT